MIVPFKGRQIDPDEPVRVYRNLHAKSEMERWSVQQGGLVVAHAGNLTLYHVKFEVSPAGWRRARRIGHRTVHAFINGYVVKGTTNSPLLWDKIIYNFAAARFAYFHYPTVFVASARLVYLGPQGVMAYLSSCL